MAPAAIALVGSRPASGMNVHRTLPPGWDRPQVRCPAVARGQLPPLQDWFLHQLKDLFCWPPPSASGPRPLPPGPSPQPQSRGRATSQPMQHVRCPPSHPYLVNGHPCRAGVDSVLSPRLPAGLVWTVSSAPGCLPLCWCPLGASQIVGLDLKHKALWLLGPNLQKGNSDMFIEFHC